MIFSSNRYNSVEKFPLEERSCWQTCTSDCQLSENFISPLSYKVLLQNSASFIASKFLCQCVVWAYVKTYAYSLTHKQITDDFWRKGRTVRCRVKWLQETIFHYNHWNSVMFGYIIDITHAYDSIIKNTLCSKLSWTTRKTYICIWIYV